MVGEEKDLLSLVLKLSKLGQLNPNQAQCLNSIIEENRLLRKANTYNQSLLDIYNKWFKELGVQEDVKREEKRGVDYFISVPKPNQPITYREFKTYRFPEIFIGSLVNDDLFQALNEATKLEYVCKTCNGNEHLMLYGKPVYICPECGRVLA